MLTATAGRGAPARPCASGPRVRVALLALCGAWGVAVSAGAEEAAAPALLAGTTLAESGGEIPDVEAIADVRPPRYGPPDETPGIPSDVALERDHAVIGQVLIDNQNIFNPHDPKEDNSLFRAANRLHVKTRASVVRSQLLFKPGDPYSARLIQESERILRADSYFYDAWIRPVRYQDGKVDLKVTTRDVWTLNPGFNYSRSGGTNSTGLRLEEANLLGTGAKLAYTYQNNVDRYGSSVDLSDQHFLNSWTAVGLSYGNFSDGNRRGIAVARPFYSLDTRTAGAFTALDDTQVDPLYDLGQIVDQFQDKHELVQASYGWSAGLKNGWVQRWSAGLTRDQHRFAPVSNSNGTTNLLPADRRFTYPFIEWDLVEDDFLKLWNHDQIGRTEDYQLGINAGARLGWAQTGFGSTSDALIMGARANEGFQKGGSTLLLASDFSGRFEHSALQNGLLNASARYYVIQSKNWLFFSTLTGTKGWNLDLDNQILLGGDNGLRGYPLRYQDGTAKALFSVEQRYFTDWYPFLLFRVGGAIFYDMGRTWGDPPLAQPSLGLLRDVGFGLRFGNARSGLGNVIHVDLAFPLDGDSGISKVQFLVTTEATF